MLIWYFFARSKHLFLFPLQFQFVNSYLSLFYIGFYLKDMERLKEVRKRKKKKLLCFCLCFCHVFLQSHLLFTTLLFNFLLLGNDFCNHPFTPLHLSVCLWKMLVVLSLLRSLQRQVRVNVLPSLLHKIQMNTFSVPWFSRTFLKSKVWSRSQSGWRISIVSLHKASCSYCVSGVDLQTWNASWSVKRLFTSNYENKK